MTRIITSFFKTAYAAAMVSRRGFFTADAGGVE